MRRTSAGDITDSTRLLEACFTDAHGEAARVSRAPRCDARGHIDSQPVAPANRANGAFLLLAELLREKTGERFLDQLPILKILWSSRQEAEFVFVHLSSDKTAVKFEFSIQLESRK